MPAFRPPSLPSDRPGAAAALSAALAGPAPRGPVTPRQLISLAGGTRKVAELLGISTRTVQRRASGRGPGLSAAEQRSLQRAVSAAQIKQAVQDLGGNRRVAELTGRSVSTVRRWTSGKIAAPKADAQQILTRARTARRMRAAGLQVDPATGRPLAPVSVKMTADLRIRGQSKSPDYDERRKNVGARNTIDIDADTIAAAVDAIGAGNRAEVQAVLEEYLSTNYASCSGYDPEAGIGLFIDRVESVRFDQDTPPTAPTSPSAPTSPTPTTPPAPTQSSRPRSATSRKPRGKS